MWGDTSNDPLQLLVGLLWCGLHIQDAALIAQYGLTLPVVLVSNADGEQLHLADTVTFPIISGTVGPQALEILCPMN